MREITVQNRCSFCNKKAAHTIIDNFNLFQESDAIKFCDDHYSCFQVGSTLGQMELNGKLLSVLLNIHDEKSGEDLKNNIFDLIPMARQQYNAMKGKRSYNHLSPKYFYDSLNKKVIGQDEAKKRISLTVYEHIRSTYQTNYNDKYNILLLGPSGSGKTLITTSIANDLEVPFVIGDATAYSPTGFQGADADSVIHELFLKTQGDIESAERGIVFIDEIDKLAGNSSKSKIESLNTNTQFSMLKLIEGKKVKIPSSVLGDQGGPATFVDTAKMLFCFGGAFTGLSDIVAEKLKINSKNIGFTKNDEKSKNDLKPHEILGLATHEILNESLIDYGLAAEFVGRIQTVVILAPLTKEELTQCLLDLDNSPINKQQILFAEHGIELEFDEEFVENIVSKVEAMGTGTRALNNMVKRSVSFAAFEHIGPHSAKPKKIIITKDCADHPEKYSTVDW
jgi:ATP-dependent Clp protease ATP-binding subunit ClpX